MKEIKNYYIREQKKIANNTKLSPSNRRVSAKLMQSVINKFDSLKTS